MSHAWNAWNHCETWEACMCEHFYSVRLWPNGEFSLGLVKRWDTPKKIKGGFIVPPMAYSWTGSEVLSYMAAMIKAGYSIEYILSLIPESQLETIRRSLPLGLSDAAKSHRRAQRGEKGLTSHGRRMLRNGCFLLERKAGKHRVAMVTTTLPATDESTAIEMSREWSEICRVFTQALSRRLKAAGAPPWVIGCVEIQEKRLNSRGGMPLHLHLVFQSKVGREYIVSKSDVCELWKRAVCSRVPSAEVLYWGASTRIEKVKKSVTRYMCKYMSKGINQNVLVSVSKGYTLPSSWWVAVGGIKHLIKRLQFVESGSVAAYLWELSVSSPKSFLWVFPISIKTDGGEFRVGYVGELSRQLGSEVRKAVEASRQARRDSVSLCVL